MTTSDFQTRLNEVINLALSNRISSYSCGASLDGFMTIEIDNRTREVFDRDGNFIQQEQI